MRNCSFRTASWIIGLAVIALAGGCSPTVYTKIQKSYPALTPGTEVIVYDLDNPVPPTAEVLGEVAVSIRKFTSGPCAEEALQIAKTETNRAGGNALMVTGRRALIELEESEEHALQLPGAAQSPKITTDMETGTEPNVETNFETTGYAQSNPDLKARMLRLPDDLYEMIRLHYLRQTPHTSKPGKTPWLQRFSKDKEYRHTLYAHPGYSISATKLYNMPGLTGDAQKGFGLTAGYQWTSRQGLGAGIRYSGHFTHLEKGPENIRIRIHYAAPEFVARQNLSERWIARETIGAGYALYTENGAGYSGRVSGFGAHINVGAEYKITPWLGIGAGLGVVITHFPNWGRCVAGGSQNAQIARVSIDGGLHFYF